MEEFIEGIVAAMWTVPGQEKVHVLARILELEREVDAQTKELQEQAVELQNRAHALEVANDKAEKLLLAD